ncbi:hypothetical protein JXA32_12075 [Candidatus Sumerlaeota bacterium]|nr:hypothetical protein [Candidatus Sumerlaeota bacterium]
MAEQKHPNQFFLLDTRILSGDAMVSIRQNTQEEAQEWPPDGWLKPSEMVKQFYIDHRRATDDSARNSGTNRESWDWAAEAGDSGCN